MCRPAAARSISICRVGGGQMAAISAYAADGAVLLAADNGNIEACFANTRALVARSRACEWPINVIIELCTSNEASCWPGRLRRGDIDLRGEPPLASQAVALAVLLKQAPWQAAASWRVARLLDAQGNGLAAS